MRGRKARRKKKDARPVEEERWEPGQRGEQGERREVPLLPSCVMAGVADRRDSARQDFMTELLL